MDDLPKAKLTRLYYPYTEEELNVLIECDHESYWKRCFPLQIFFGGSVITAAKTGYLKTTRNMMVGHVVVALFVAFFIGKYSYRKTCEEKLMELNGPLGRMLKEQRRRDIAARLGVRYGDSESLKPFNNVNPAEEYSDIQEKPRRASGMLDVPKSPKSKDNKNDDDFYNSGFDESFSKTEDEFVGEKPDDGNS